MISPTAVRVTRISGARGSDSVGNGPAIGAGRILLTEDSGAVGIAKSSARTVNSEFGIESEGIFEEHPLNIQSRATIKSKDMIRRFIRIALFFRMPDVCRPYKVIMRSKKRKNKILSMHCVRTPEKGTIILITGVVEMVKSVFSFPDARTMNSCNFHSYIGDGYR